MRCGVEREGILFYVYRIVRQNHGANRTEQDLVMWCRVIVAVCVLFYVVVTAFI